MMATASPNVTGYTTDARADNTTGSSEVTQPQSLDVLRIVLIGVGLFVGIIVIVVVIIFVVSKIRKKKRPAADKSTKKREEVKEEVKEKEMVPLKSDTDKPEDTKAKGEDVATERKANEPEGETKQD